MTVTPIPSGTIAWDVPLNAALVDLQAQATSLQNQVTTNLDNLTYNAKNHGVTGNGSTDDYAALQALLNLAYTDSASAPQGAEVFLPPGTYRLSQGVIVPPYVTLRGSYAMRGTNIQKSILKPLSSFSGTGVIYMYGQTLASPNYLTRSEGQRLVNLTIDGSALPGTTSGIVATGDVHGVYMQNVSVDRATDRGVQTVASGADHPYSWYLDNVQISTATLDGFRLSSTTDTTLIGCRAIGCGRRGYYLDGMANSSFTACRSEFSGENGWYITGSWGTGTGSGGAVWQGCSTDRSVQNGFLVDATGNPTLTFTGLMCRRDGSGSTSSGYAGFKVSSATTPITIDGIATYPGVNDDGSGLATPQYGLSITGSTSVSYGNASLHAITAGFIDGGTNTLVGRGVGVLERTGPTSAPVNVIRGLQTYGATGGSLDVPDHISGLVQPREHGAAVAWSIDPAVIGSGKAGVAGTLYLAALYVPRTASLTKLFWGINTAGASITAGQNFVSLFDSTGTRQANVGVDARVTTTGLFTETISVSATAGLYWVGFLFNATTMPAVYRGGDLNATLLNFNTTASTTRFATNGTALTATPASITTSSNTNAQFSYWAAVG